MVKTPIAANHCQGFRLDAQMRAKWLRPLESGPKRRPLSETGPYRPKVQTELPWLLAVGYTSRFVCVILLSEKGKRPPRECGLSQNGSATLTGGSHPPSNHSCVTHVRQQFASQENSLSMPSQWYKYQPSRGSFCCPFPCLWQIVCFAILGRNFPLC